MLHAYHRQDWSTQAVPCHAAFAVLEQEASAIWQLSAWGWAAQKGCHIRDADRAIACKALRGDAQLCCRLCPVCVACKEIGHQFGVRTVARGRWLRISNSLNVLGVRSERRSVPRQALCHVVAVAPRGRIPTVGKVRARGRGKSSPLVSFVPAPVGWLNRQRTRNTALLTTSDWRPHTSIDAHERITSIARRRSSWTMLHIVRNERRWPGLPLALYLSLTHSPRTSLARWRWRDGLRYTHEHRVPRYRGRHARMHAHSRSHR